MITIDDIKNFFQEYWGYLLLGVSGFSLLGVVVYYFTADNQQPVTIEQNEALKEVNQTKEENSSKTQQVVLDPVIDNSYWLVASFIVYYSVYLILKENNYKREATWAIPVTIFLWKVILSAFSSFYYQKNDFLQNLINKSINPVYFIQQQDFFKIFFSVACYSTLFFSIYNDLRNLNNNQNGRQRVEIPIVDIVNQNQGNENINLVTSFTKTLNASMYYICFVSGGGEKFDNLKTRISFDFDGFKNSIINGIQAGKISQNGINNLIGYNFTTEDPDNLFKKDNYQKMTLFDSFFNCLKKFIKNEGEDGKKDENDVEPKKMVNIFLNALINDPTDGKILSLKELMNEFYFFASSINALHYQLFNENFKIKSNIFKTAQEAWNSHLKFARELVKESSLKQLFLNQQGVDIDQCQDVEKMYNFLINNKTNLNNQLNEQKLKNVLASLNN